MSDAILAAEKALHEAALARATAYQRYAEVYGRTRQVSGEPLNPETQAACNVAVRADHVMDRAAVRFAIAHGLLPAGADSRLRWLDDPEPSYCPRCNRNHEREGEAEENCQRGMQFANADHHRRGGTI